MKSLTEEITDSLKIIPNNPGVYHFIDSKGEIIYIGKAKNLKNRVHSYFSGKHDHFKTRLLVNSICKIEYLIVDNEADALLLENNLIKTHQPKYNVLLKDDKTYPWIEVKKEPFPRVRSTRKKDNKGSLYFGPFPNVRQMNLMINLIDDLFHVRTCSLDLSLNKIERKKYSVCLEYHIGNCKGPCESKQTMPEYDAMMGNIILLLEGKHKALFKLLKKQMTQFAEAYEFEKAEQLKKIMLGLNQYRTKSIIVSDLHDLDVLTIEEVDDVFYFNYMVIKEGAIMNAYNHKVNKKLNENPGDFIALNITVLKEKFNSRNKQIITNFPLDFPYRNYQFSTPQRGDKKKLLDLSLNNIKHYINNEKKKALLSQSKNHQTRILETIRKDFKLQTLPEHMECFDNSNLQGTNAVSACVVFKMGKPSKKEYRHFNVKTVSGPDDFETMKEVVYRRYKRLVSENKSLPDLIIIDGGKGQLNAANAALEELELKGKITIAGIAKRLEELFLPGEKHPLYLDKRSESLKVIQFMRNEAHRFSIAHHRNKRSKSALQSELENIKGIGPKSRELLFKEFKTIEQIKAAELSLLIKVMGPSKAKVVYNYYSKT